MIRSLKVTILAAAALLLLVALACDDDEVATQAPAPTQPPATTAPATTAPATTAPATTAPATATAAPTAAATATKPPVQAGPSGTITGVIGGLGVGTPSGWPTDCLWCASIVMVGVQESLLQMVRNAAGAAEIKPWLAESWTTAPDLTYTDFKLQKGVMFHQGYGELTAADVEYTFRAAMPTYTKEARHDTLPIPALKEVTAIDANTVRFVWNAYNGLTLFENFSDYGEGIGIFSKKAIDEKGVEWARLNVVGTGPFTMTEWTAQKIIDLKAQTSHWRKVPFADRIKLLEIPEDAVRRAQLENGEADMGEVPLKDWKSLLDKGFKKSNEQIINGIEIIMGGQYWSEKGADGVALNRVLDKSKPWIGDPYAADCDRADILEKAKPTGAVCASMEIPRKFRWALAQDIDRAGIVAAYTQGQGGPLYIRTHPDDPIVKANPGRWDVKYDQAAAKKLMSEAYPSGLAGPITWWVGPSGLEVEVSEAVAAQWLTDLGVKTEFDRRVYTAQRPNMVDRTSVWLQTRNCCNPGTRILAEEWIMSSAVPTGYNHAQELPFATSIYNQKIKEQDLAKIQKLTEEFIDHHYFWMIDIGVTAPPASVLLNSKTIAEWPQRPFNQWRIGGMRNQLEYLKPVQK